MQMIKRDNGPTRGITPFSALFDDALWDPFGLFGSPFVPRRSFPAMNIAETAKELTVSVNVPGFEAKDVTVDVHNNVLTISGHAQETEEKNDQEWICRESAYGEFTRQVRLPDYADGSKANCKVKNGVLTIMIPKKEEAAKKTLQVEEE
ncbi:MAG: Hsp20/alpha crystallin family protein [Candidatus Peribacteraceae bacterium]|nr:Hsp20/alpha crystallin family protein [Candidatus Peribacteraceae bacterium]MDD5739513.1 Hsp20/alpha crystallin family protein [Candidatus Peribacteraceae bacterium]